MALANLSEVTPLDTTSRREELRVATREFRHALRQIVGVLGNCLEAADSVDAAAIAPLEREYEEAADHLLAFSKCVAGIREAHKL